MSMSAPGSPSFFVPVIPYFHIPVVYNVDFMVVVVVVSGVPYLPYEGPHTFLLESGLSTAMNSL